MDYKKIRMELIEKVKDEVLELLLLITYVNIDNKKEVKDYIKYIFELNNIELQEKALEKIYNEIVINYKERKGVKNAR